VVTIPLAPRTARAIDLATGERTDGPIFSSLRQRGDTLRTACLASDRFGFARANVAVIAHDQGWFQPAELKPGCMPSRSAWTTANSRARASNVWARRRRGTRGI
jgi:hypothetical protein